MFNKIPGFPGFSVICEFLVFFFGFPVLWPHCGRYSSTGTLPTGALLFDRDATVRDATIRQGHNGPAGTSQSDRDPTIQQGSHDPDGQGRYDPTGTQRSTKNATVRQVHYGKVETLRSNMDVTFR